MNVLGGVEHGCVDREITPCLGVVIPGHVPGDAELEQDDECDDEADEGEQQASASGTRVEPHDGGHFVLCGWRARGAALRIVRTRIHRR